MTKKTKKRYVVWKGKSTGIFTSWDECKKSVHGFAWAQYKSFEDHDSAKYAFANKYSHSISATKKKVSTSVSALISSGVIDSNSICVDAACSSNPWILERRGVETISWKTIFSSTQYPLGTTNVGEWLAIIEGMQYLLDSDKKEWTLYSDSRIALGWARASTIRTWLIKNSSTQALWTLVDKQLQWLQQNSHLFVLKKRKTKERGEIPADFWRK